MTELAICAVGAALYAIVVARYCAKIAALKRRRKASGQPVPPASGAHKASLVLCALVETLPLLIPLQPYVVVILAACGVLGAALVMKERLEMLERGD